MAEYEKLIAEIDTYEKYLDNTGKVQAFYKQLCEDTKNLCIRMREYSVNYAEEIMASDQPNDERYEDFEELYDCIYDDAGDDIYDEIYDEYCEIVKKYTENPSDMELLADYTEMLTKAAEMTEKFEAWEDSDLNDAELEYYLDVQNRITKKLLKLSQ